MIRKLLVVLLILILISFTLPLSLLINGDKVYADLKADTQYKPISSNWAYSEIIEAEGYGLIPDIIKNSDLTKPITREEFCELALALYEKTTGKSPEEVSSNPFSDTKNQQILKAFALGITQGTSSTTFSPQVLINREQCAAMLFRTIKAIYPEGDYSTAGAENFNDQEHISSYADEATKFMSKLGIIKGDNNGNFMPKATSSAQTVSGYGMATREAAILMSVRSFGKIETIKISSEDTKPKDLSYELVGKWVLGTISGEQFNSSTGKYEGGATGLGQMYNFKSDGSYESIVIWSSTIYITGKYSVKDGIITLSERVSQESGDGGKAWNAAESLPDASAYFNSGTDESGKYLLLGEEGGKLPLVDKENALKYKWKE